MAIAQQDATLDQMWERTRIEFHERTSFDIGTGKDSDWVPESLKEKLDAVNSPKESKPDKEKALRIMNNVLVCVKLIGGLASQAASQVFAPAGMCFNAVSFLVDGVKQISKFHVDLAALFTSVQTFVIHFRILKRVEGRYGEAGLPKELIFSANELLQSFVRICLHGYLAISRSRTKRIVNDLKAAYLKDDGGVAAELSNFESLINKHQAIEGSVTLEEVLKNGEGILAVQKVASKIEGATTRLEGTTARMDETTARTDENVQKLERDMTTKNNKDATERRLIDIAKKLGIESRKDPKDPPPLWKTQTDKLRDIKEDRMDNTGSWLSDQELYQAWRSLSTQQEAVLCLQGRKGTGKTFTTSRIIDDWQSGSNSEARSAVAFYFFDDKDDGQGAVNKSDTLDGRGAISQALRCMAYMLARANPKYALDLDLARSRDGSDWTVLAPKELLGTLGLTSSRPTMFVLVFDGLDQIKGGLDFIRAIAELDGHATLIAADAKSENEVKVSSQLRTFRPRVMATIGPDDLSLGSDIAILKLLNDDDLARFIDNKIRTDLGANFKSRSELLSRFKSRLIEIADGSFSIVENRFRRIRQRMQQDPRLEEVKKVMFSDNTDELEDSAKQALQEMEEALTALEIKQINAVLVWCLCSWGGPLSIDEIDAVTALDTESAMFQTFFERLEQNPIYSNLFEKYSDGKVERVGVVRHMATWLRSDKANHVAVGVVDIEREQPLISLQLTIQKAEPQAVKRFLWDLQEKITYDKSFFTVAGSEQHNQERIAYDETRALSTITNQCLDVLTADYDEHAAALQVHAFRYLPLYIWEVDKAIDRQLDKIVEDQLGSDIVDFPDLGLIVTKLVRFFKKDNLAKFVKALAEDDVNPVPDWFEDKDNVSAMQRLLGPARIKHMPPHQQLTLDLLLQEPPEGRYLSITRQVGREWLLNDEWKAEDGPCTPFKVAFDWVASYLTMTGAWNSADIADPPIDGTKAAKEPNQERKEGEKDSDVNEAPIPSPPSPNLGLPTPPQASPPRSTSPPVDPSMIATDLQVPAADIPSLDNAEEETRSEVEEPPAALPDLKDRITQASTWVRNQFNATSDGTFLERLGLTYYFYDCFPEAKETLHEALVHHKRPALIYHILARVHNWQGEYEQAIQQVLKALECPNTVNLDEPDAEMPLKKQLAGIYDKAERHEDALLLYEQLIAAQPDEYDAYDTAIGICYVRGWDSKAKDMLDRLSKDVLECPEHPTGKISRLTKFLIHVTEELGIPHKIIAQANACGFLNALLTSLHECQEIRQSADKEHDESIAVVRMHITEGYAQALQDRGRAGHQKAIRSWYEALRKGATRFEEGFDPAVEVASYHYVELLSSESRELQLRKIKDLISHDHRVGELLTQAYVVADQPEQAISQSRRLVEDALELLHNDTTLDDWEGYWQLTHPLASAGFVELSLAAWSLIQPVKSPSPGTDPAVAINNSDAVETAEKLTVASFDGPESVDIVVESKMVSDVGATNTVSDQPTKSADAQAETSPELKGPLAYPCDGDCRKVWTYPDDLWECRVCPSRIFCPGCFEKLKRGELKKWVCHEQHSWYHIPAWNDKENERVPSGSVCIPRHVGNGEYSREDGEIVEIKEWIKRIIDIWGIKKFATKVEETEKNDEANTA